MKKEPAEKFELTVWPHGAGGRWRAILKWETSAGLVFCWQEDFKTREEAIERGQKYVAGRKRAALAWDKREVIEL